MLLAFAGAASAVGLGDLRAQLILGEGLALEIPLLGVEKQPPAAQCFKLVSPQGGGDLPWLKKATLTVRQGATPVLEVRNDAPVREPIVQMAVYLGCGNEVSREYTLVFSPRSSAMPAVPETPVVERQQTSGTGPVAARRKSAASDDKPARENFRHDVERRKPAAMALSERVMPPVEAASVRWANVDVGEPSLRLATSLASVDGAGRTSEAQRELLRLEFRMLMAMQEQASTQLEASEKLRRMESSLGELKQRAAEFAQRVEESRPLTDAANPPPPTRVNPPVPVEAAPTPVVDQSESSGLWRVAAALLGALLGVGGWLGWRHWQAARERSVSIADVHSVIPDIRIDPQRSGEHEERGGIDLPVEPAAMGMPMQVDVELDGHAEPTPPPAAPAPPKSGLDSMMSIAATSVDEHFEANPVMELADIMLSFGRVKGAAQALQEYIDNNPQEALKPWIRLIEVYRMAGMRQEFEDVARNLNRNFNVEVQQWDASDATPRVLAEDEAPALAIELPSRPLSVEDMPRIMNTVVEMWNHDDVVGYLFQLLRDNRGGQRLGFALPVVEDILFLIELKETANRME